MGFDWNPAFCKYCNKLQVPQSCLLNRVFLFLGLKVIGWSGRGRVGAILSAVEVARQLHLLGYFDPFFF